MTKRIISGILSFAIMLSALTIFADNNADIKNTSSIWANAYVDDSGQVVSSNMKVYTGDSGLNNFSIKGGKKGWLFDILSAKTDNYLYMDIDDNLLDKRDKGRIIKVSVDYFDAGTSSFAIEYTNREGTQVETPYKEFEGSLKWKTHTFTIMDAYLTNGVNGADLRLSSKTKNMQTSLENFTVSKVSVEITNTFNQVSIKAETNSYGNHFFTGEEIDFKYTLDNSEYAFESHTKYGGLMIVMKINAANRIITELLNYDSNVSYEKGNGSMKNEHHNNLILISVNEGYSEDVMQVAKKAGATGGTVIKGRLADAELFNGIAETGVDGDREILCILAPLNTSKQIMEDVNKEYGTTSKANGIILAIPTEKAYKI